MKRLGWSKLTPDHSGKFAEWKHESGWHLQHCGHPTALFPWQAFDPDGVILLAPYCKCFRRLLEAMEAVEAVIAGSPTRPIEIALRGLPLEHGRFLVSIHEGARS